MERIYKISFITYRFVLGLFLIFSVIGKILVGVAGHSGQKDYLVFTFLIITVGLLTVLNRLHKRESLTRNIVRFSVLFLVVTSIIFGIYSLYDTFINNYHSFGDIIMNIVVILFILISLALCMGLIKDKI